MYNKLAPELRSRLRSKGGPLAAAADVAPADPEAVERVGLLVEFTGDLADLTAVGFEPRSVVEHPTQGYKIATGTIPVERLEELAAIDHVVDTEGPRRYFPALNYSLPEIHARVLHTGTPSHQGENVVIGVIDSGIDWRHGSFVKPDGQSRILALWDQWLTAEAGEAPVIGLGGVEYTQAQITQALQGHAAIRSSNETNAHGTHVAGIAAGNGRPASCCTGAGTYVGVAPKADLIVVHYDYRLTEELGANTRLADALDYLFNHGSVAGSPPKPLVVNVSQGDNLGPHDGTSLVERTINAHVAGGPGRVVVVAAGNFANTQCHVKGTVPGTDDLEIELKIREGHESDAYLDLWYDRAGTLNLEVIPNAGTGSGTVSHGADPAPFVVNPTEAADRQFSVDIGGTINAPHNRDNNFRIRIIKPSSGNIPAGDWKLKLTNPNAAAVNFHCWIERGNFAPQFLPAVDPPDGKVRSSTDSTLSIPSTASGAITVANYSGKTDGCDCCPDNDIHASSSRGPVARLVAAPGDPPNHKPDIAAPGTMITSAKADAANLVGNCCSCCPDACCCLYHDMTGTSMAAPHVAGAIALILEKNHRLTKEQILAHLQRDVSPRPAGGTQEAWGAGLLNIEVALAGVPPASAFDGGGGPVPPPAPIAFTGGAPQLPPALRILRARMDALPEGQHVAAVVSRHFSEVRRLINTNRRVAAMWHRGEGPRLLHRLLRGALDASVPAPISSEPQRQYVERWLDLLDRYGSQRLKASIERYRPLLIRLLGSPLAAQVAVEAAGAGE